MDKQNLLSTGEIGTALGYTPQSVRNAAKELGLEPCGRSGRRLLYSLEQANVIASHFGKEFVWEANEAPIESNQSESGSAQAEQIEFLKQQIAAKDAEIAEKNKQISSLLENLTTAQGQLVDAQASIKALSATVTVHTASEHRDLIAANSVTGIPSQKSAVVQEEEDESPRVDDLTRWQRFKSVFWRRKKG